VNIAGRLVWLLSRVRDAGLRIEMEEQLRKSVSEQQKRYVVLSRVFCVLSWDYN
jgi:hypothetical protein